MYYDYDNEPNEITISITFGIGENPNVIFTYCGDDPKVGDGEWEDEDGNPITPTDEMIAYIDQQLWVQYTIGWAEPQSVLIDGVFVTYTLEISKGVAVWQFHSISATDWEGGYDEPTLDLSTLSQEQVREIITKADQQIGDKFVGYYPQWKVYNHIDLVDCELW